MRDQQIIRQVAEKLLKRRKVLLDRLRVNTEAWNVLHGKKAASAGRAVSKTLTLPIEGLDEKGFRELSGVDKALRKILRQ